ncbi:acetyl-CoA C-acetyltransferase [Paraburkholderia sp. UCT70]|uniref:acetyl-CoA acetyltransferase n=1 Tax=Paraburkholderia sp. UCT70 TaxID=2991068 RepID=UPI003D1DCDBA
MGVAIVGWAHLPFGRFDGASLEDLIVRAGREAVKDAGLQGEEIDGTWLGNLNGGLVPDIFASSLTLNCSDGLRWKPAVRVENACASGAAAIYSACDAIEAGRARTALVIGAEKMTDVSGEDVTRILGNCAYSGEAGNPPGGFPGIFASIAQDYFAEYGDHSSALARIAAKNHANGVDNPWAHMRRDLGFEFCNTVSEKNPMIAPPLRKTDCSLISDGAAALVLASSDAAADFPRAISIRSRVQVNDYLPLGRRHAASFEGPKRAWRGALERAGCAVDDLSFAEVHDCFTIAELLSYEAMGLAAAGQGHRLIEEGVVARGGRLPVNASGGLKAKGHPIGATGVSMHAIAAMQLTNTAGAMQVPDASLAGVFNMGGSAVASYVSILERSR